MSTLGYANLTNARDRSPPGRGINRPPKPDAPGAGSDAKSDGDGQARAVGVMVDAMAALVPSEVLAVHALVVNTLYDTARGFGGHSPGMVEALFWAMVLLAAGFFVVPRLVGGRFDKWDPLRALIAPAAFVGWSALQPVSLFYQTFAVTDRAVTTAFVLIAAVGLSALAGYLARLARAKPAG